MTTLQEIAPDTKLTELTVRQLLTQLRDALNPGGDQDKVMSIAEWAKLAGISYRTASEHVQRGTGPKIVQLSDNRIGIRVCDHRAWLAARTR